ncbi:hypothetical protein FB567DRAFT_432484 [Paraphoma chrysanthemicola]|uniref:Uncharacterized protein n=1 Tax=Paraphoma chrysanthemicola TaxID=798071 RepID=A0A8K0W4Y5_9PLEO|nr:hypothetical protein FB567DRAFT_432484 [Paraphoma chrysanthemicola]
MSSTSSLDAEAADPLVAETAKRIADVINDFKHQLDQRDGTCAHASGRLEVALDTQTFLLSVVPDVDGDEFPITVHAQLKPSNATNSNTPEPTAHHASTYRPTRRTSDAELERDLVSRKKRRLDEDGDTGNMRPRTGDGKEDIMPLITKDDLDDLLSKLREDIQEDTSECINHVQRLLRRFKEEWHEQSKYDHEQSQTQQPKSPFRDSLANNASVSASFPSPNMDRDDHSSSVPDVVRRETRLVSAQIKWVEDCRRIAADIHEKREENWRKSSASFHDRQRQNCETFQNRILHESSVNTATLNQILSEVKAIGSYAQSMKWETPTSHSMNMALSTPTPPAFPTQPSMPSPTQNQARTQHCDQPSKLGAEVVEGHPTTIQTSDDRSESNYPSTWRGIGLYFQEK